MSYAYNKAEIDLCCRLGDLGVRPEIRGGDWVVLERESHSLTPILVHYTLSDNHGKFYVLLWTWERARAWLREGGWYLDAHSEVPDGRIKLKFYRIDKMFGGDKSGRGATDLEAILAMMVAVAEGEK